MFRKITTLAFATLTFGTAFAQETHSDKALSPMRKGNFNIGLNADLPQLGIDDNGNLNYQLSLNPNAGYFLTNNLLLIGQLHAGAYQYTSSYYSQVRGQFIGTGFDFRWYFGTPEKKSAELRRFRMFAQLGASIDYYWHQSNEGGRFQSRNHSPELELRGGVGGSYLITKRFALETSLIYKQWAIDYHPGSGEGVIDGQLGFRMFLGSRK